jgi:3-hydroxyisobutyrate dehydrogenase-like beta-hydroxyacid dehydrogenase
MSEATVIGLGAMGTALARCLLCKRSVTVWNRSPQKVETLKAEGATIALSIADAVAASPIVLICVSDYTATKALLAERDTIEALEGRIVIQLSTGTPAEAAESSAFFTANKALYLDGAIKAYPAGVGTAEAIILLAGTREAFERAGPVLRDLAGDPRYLGENVRAPAALDLAWLSRLEGLIMGTLHGASICEAEGIPLAQLIPMMPEGDRARSLLSTIEAGDFAVGPNAGTVSVAAGVIARLQDQAIASGINSEFPDLMMAWLERAMAMDCGNLDTAATIKALRAGGPTTVI